MPKEYICPFCGEVFDPWSWEHDCDSIDMTGKCTNCLGHCPVCRLDKKEHIASIIFDFEGENYKRPSKEDCHKIADEIMEKCSLYTERGDSLKIGDEDVE